MDDEIKVELAKLLDPASILPNLRLKRACEETPQHEVSPDDTIKSERSEETDKDYMPGENETISPPEKKFKPADSLSPAITSRDLYFRIKGDKVISFCQEHGLLATEVMCSCGKPMRLFNKMGSDGCRWMCYDKSHPSKPIQTIRKGTWFEGAKLALRDIIWIAYMWVHEYSLISMMHECDHSNTTVMGWCASCNDFCREVVESKSEPIGGEEMSVEIFYCPIRERKRATDRWAFGAIEHNTGKSLHFVNEDEESSTLLQIFDNYIRPGTKVLVNNWWFLKTLNIEDFTYLTEKKSISFIDVLTNNTIYSFETFKKKTSRTRVGKLDEWSKIEYGPNFFMKVYRKCLQVTPDAFLTFLNDIAMIYKPSNTYCTIPLETLK